MFIKLTNIKPVGVVCLELVQLRLAVLPRQFDVRVGSVKALGQIHLQAFRGGNGNMTAAILAEQLSKHLEGVAVSAAAPLLGALLLGIPTRPVGPAPNIRTLEPRRGRILSRPWQAQDAGSINVASTSDMLWILKTLP